MKKFLIVLCSMLVLVGLLVGCAKKEQVDLIRQGVSEMTKDVLEGSNESFSASIYVGQRENAPSLDGVANALNEYFMIRVMPKAAMTLQSVEYKLMCGDKTYNGVLAKSNSNRGYVQDLKKIIPYTDSVKIEITYGDKKCEIPLKSVITPQMQTSEMVYKKVYDKNKEMLDSMIVNGKFSGEIIIRLINDSGTSSKNYFWYVAIIDSNKKINSMLVDAVKGDFVA